jgi:hypothetical protein
VSQEPKFLLFLAAIAVMISLASLLGLAYSSKTSIFSRSFMVSFVLLATLLFSTSMLAAEGHEAIADIVGYAGAVGFLVFWIPRMLAIPKSAASESQSEGP